MASFAKPRAWRMPALLVGSLLVASCVGYSRHDDDFEAAPADVKRDWTLVKQRCSQCHAVDKVFLNVDWIQKDKGDIEFMVEDMASKPGANIRDHEVVQIVEVLDWWRQQ